MRTASKRVMKFSLAETMACAAAPEGAGAPVEVEAGKVELVRWEEAREGAMLWW